MVAPVLDNDQRHTGAAASLALRQNRALIKLQVEYGELTFGQALESPVAAGMKVTSLLQALPGVARRRADSLLVAARIPEGTTVRALGPKQLERLLAALAKRR